MKTGFKVCFHKLNLYRYSWDDTPAAVRTAYKKAALKFHPDRTRAAVGARCTLTPPDP